MEFFAAAACFTLFLIFILQYLYRWLYKLTGGRYWYWYITFVLVVLGVSVVFIGVDCDPSPLLSPIMAAPFLHINVFVSMGVGLLHVRQKNSKWTAWADIFLLLSVLALPVVLIFDFILFIGAVWGCF